MSYCKNERYFRKVDKLLSKNCTSDVIKWHCFARISQAYLNMKMTQKNEKVKIHPKFYS